MRTPEAVLGRIKSQPAQPCSATLRTFFGQKGIASKKIKLPISHKGQCTEAEFFIVKPNVPVTLSGCVAERLGLISRISSIDASGCNTPQGFEDVFQGLGDLKDVAYHIQLKPGAQGTVKPARRVAVALQDRGKAELQRIESAGVIANVTERTSW